MNLDTNVLVDSYMLKKDWRVKENSNSPYSYGTMNKFLVGEISKKYWEDRVYDKEASEAHKNGFIHIHDMSGLTIYCCGYSLQKILDEGIRGLTNIPTSAPAKHLDSALNQLSNLVTIFQNEIMGAVAFSSVDTLLSPFIKKDKLSYEQVKQHIQNFVYSINSNSRAGSEPAFSNTTFDLVVPPDLKDLPAKIGGEMQDFTYADCQEEMNLFNRAFFDVMLEGDSAGKAFAYPIPTYSITKDFDWDNKNYEKLWEMAGTYGYPYFSNFINSDMEPSDVRSMCCRLRLDLSQLAKRNGGLFGSGDSTGSVGVVTLNLPRLGYLNKDKSEEDLLIHIKDYMEISKRSLEDKRTWLEKNILGTGMIPAFDTYVGTLNNHFSTIGFVGLNEMCENFLGKDILSEEGKALSLKVLDYMRDILLDFQRETGHLYNLEATPAESTCYRLAKLDKNKFENIKSQGKGQNVYYTNSCHIPVKKIKSIKSTLDHQDDLQTKMTGGTVVHFYLEKGITAEKAKSIVKNSCENYSLPYISLSPVICHCPTCGFIETPVDICPTCGELTKKQQRITGYIREVDNFNPGKRQEFEERMQLNEN